MNAESVDQLVFEHNNIIYLGWAPGESDQLIASLVACKNVSLFNNNFSSNRKQGAVISKMDSTHLKIDIATAQTNQ